MVNRGAVKSRSHKMCVWSLAGFIMIGSTRKYMQYEDIRVPEGVHTVESLNYAWKEFETRDDDVFNVTYPKSGTTWLQEILSLVYSNGDPTPVKTTLSWDRVPWIEQHSGRQHLEHKPSPRLITTHLPFHLFPQSFSKTKAKAIYTIRNPKDVCVSLYHFSKFAQFMEYREDFQDFVSLFLSKDIIFGRWFEHVKGWLTIKDNPNLLILSYEDMLKDLKSNVIKISKFLGKELDDAAIDSVVEHSSFHAMKANPMSNYSAVPNDVFNKDQGNFHRKGIAGDYKNHFTPAQEEEFERIYKECMEDINISLLKK
ncbi:3-beta-hydroxysteroid sulfotransferase-like isoform X2 [Hyla sarda]|uniref:3-beta-hydroxysteroid sulfotransferase-like isoform X2 n=1 Tax=Hyla sarda TaxID=327740 RepID=UPI0024C36992|nr:3-beta-hydroxysteroid sulfotransferase-like isoform X2 [Hyla sarda]